MKKEKNTKSRVKDWKKSIQGEIKHHVVIIVLAAICILAGVATIMNYYSTINMLEETMDEMSDIAAESIANRIMASENVVKEIGAVARLSNPEITVEEKRELVGQKIEAYGCIRGGVIRADGVDIFSGENYSEMTFFQKAMQGEYYISVPILNKETGKTEIYFTAPLWKNGLMNTEIEGVVYLVPQEYYLDDIVKEINISANGSAYILDKDGYTIAHENHEQVVNRENTNEDAKTNSKLAKLASIEQKMANGEDGFDTYTYGGVKKFLSYAPIENTDGWSIGVNAPQSDFMGATVLSIIVTIILGVVLIIIASGMAVKLAKSIGAPIRICAERLHLLADGDLHTEIAHIHREDELGTLAEATEKIVATMTTMIQDISYVMGNMGEGNFAVHSKARESFVGDFADILQSERKIVEKLSEAIKGVREATGQVALGSVQLSEGSQNLAEGATDQASSVEELLATVTDVTDKVAKNSEEAAMVGKNAQIMGEEAKESTKQMEQMRNAMERISEKSSQISGVIQSIEEIADQTNLLALNASIEAARAGEKGRGFAVVANEIGTLAKQSGDAVESTRRLIEDSLREVESGHEIVDVTAKTLETLIKGLENIVKEIEKVGEASAQQAEMIQQINSGVEQISAVIEENSASAEGKFCNKSGT